MLEEEKKKREFLGTVPDERIIKSQTFNDREIKVPIKTNDIGFEKKIKVSKSDKEADLMGDEKSNNKDYVEVSAEDKPGRILRDLNDFYYISLKNKNKKYRWVLIKN